MSDSPNLLKKSMQGVRDGLARAGQGLQKAGQATKRGIQRAKGQGSKEVQAKAGFTEVDAYTEEDDEQRRKKKARNFFGDDEPSFVSVRKSDPKRDLSTISPEFRAQVSAGLAAANSHTTGSTLVEAPTNATGAADEDERW
jgi:hypothetical protein